MMNTKSTLKVAFGTDAGGFDWKVDPDTGTWRLRGKFDNPDQKLACGLFVRIRLPIGTEHAATLVSEKALGTDQGQKFVYVVDDKHVVSTRQVEIGPLHHGLRAIAKGLQPGETVIVSGLQRARPGIVVAPVVMEMQAAAAPAKLD